MRFTIEIPDEELREKIKEVIAARLARSAYENYETRELKLMYRVVIKEMIYEPALKAEIINRTVNQAASQIRSKAIPILTQKLVATAEQEDSE